jgi:hypothetical protein
MNDEKLKALLMGVRAALLSAVDAIEVYLEMKRTKDIRNEYKSHYIENLSGIGGYNTDAK